MTQPDALHHLQPCYQGQSPAGADHPDAVNVKAAWDQGTGERCERMRQKCAQFGHSELARCTAQTASSRAEAWAAGPSTCSASACSCISSPLREQPPSARSSRSAQPASAAMASATSRVCTPQLNTLSMCLPTLSPARGGAASIAVPVACAAVLTTGRALLRSAASAALRVCTLVLHLGLPTCRQPVVAESACMHRYSCLPHHVPMHVCTPCRCLQCRLWEKQGGLPAPHLTRRLPPGSLNGQNIP